MENRIVKKIFWILLLVPVLFFNVACEEEEPAPEIEFDDPDSKGNLVIANSSEEALALYNGVTLIKKIPSSIQDFLVYIPVDDASMSIELRLYKYEHIKDDPNNPDNAQIFKKWVVPLSQETDKEKRATWLVNKDDTENNAGTLRFSYIGGTDNFVDVFLNGREGAKILSLKAGDQYNKSIGIDYGTYTLHYRYWISNQNNPDGVEELGWIDEIGEGNDAIKIYTTLNDEKQEKLIQIPHYFTIDPNLEQGEIQIVNNLLIGTIIIYMNGEPIETSMIYNGYVGGMSNIDQGDNRTFTLVADTLVKKHFIAKTMGGVELATLDTLIKPNEKVVWEVE